MVIRMPVLPEEQGATSGGNESIEDVAWTHGMELGVWEGEIEPGRREASNMD